MSTNSNDSDALAINPPGLVVAIAGIAVLVGLVILIRVFYIGPGMTPVPSTQPEKKPGPAVKSGQELVAAGKQLYTTHCAQCHGDDGNGNGQAARFLYPKPRNFREGKFRVVTTTNQVPSDEDLMNVITRGMPGSAMVPFAHLGEGDRQGLVAYVRHLTRTGIEEKLKKEAADAGGIDAAELVQAVDRLTVPGETLAVPKDMPAANNDSITRGHKIYLAACASCHGQTGKGDGTQEQKDDEGIPITPRDYTRGIFKGGRDTRQLYARIKLGMRGTPMPQAPTNMQPSEIGDLVNYIQSLSDPKAQERVEHKRSQLVANKVADPLGDEIPAKVWQSAKAVPIVISPLWWRNYAEPALEVAAVHDGKSVAIRLTWRDASHNEQVGRPEDFEDMAAVQLFKGTAEPFLGMGAENAHLDLWLWRASWQASASDVPNLMDDYPFESAIYQKFLKGKEKGVPDFLTARAAGNLHVHPEPTQSASSLTAKGFGSTTFRPRASQQVSARATWKDGQWTVVLRRPLGVSKDDGLSLTAGDKCSIAFAIWDGAAYDRNGQKLVSIWHDLKLE